MNIIFKYIISGGTAAVVDLVILNYLDKLNFHYLISINIAFLFAFTVSFTLQKYWTFHDAKSGKTHHQVLTYFIVSFFNIFINSLIIHLLLSYNFIPEDFILREIVIAQIIASALIAIESFIVYRFFIFKKSFNGNLAYKPSILIITQKLDINDSFFGFFHDWVIRFSKNCGKVTVIALEVGKYDLPENVKVLSLKKGSKIKSLKLLLTHSFRERDNYDFVFCHMSPLYVISGYVLWRLLHKEIGLWYVHRSVDLKLRIATLFSDIIFTATPESLRIQSKKVYYMGQAVDIERFIRPQNFEKKSDSILRIITVGRVTPIKNLDVLIKAIDIVRSKNILVELSIIGAPIVPTDFEYKKMLEDLIRDRNLSKEVSFTGLIANKDLPEFYWKNNVCVNLSPTGGLDKTVLEAMAASMPVVLVNKAFSDHLDGFISDLLVEENNIEDFAQKLINLYTQRNYDKIGEGLFVEVKKRSSLDSLIQSIMEKIHG